MNMPTDNPYAMAIILIVGVLGASVLIMCLFYNFIDMARKPEIERRRNLLLTQIKMEDAARLAIRRADEEYNSKLHAAILGAE